MIAIDTNILVYAHRADAEWHQPASHAVRSLAEGAGAWAIPWPEWTLDRLAGAAHVTSRHLLRLFSEHAEVSPMTYVEKIRLERARQALQRGASVTNAAEVAGFASDLQLRRAWARHFSGTPRQARAA